MQDIQDLRHEAHLLGEELRRYRGEVAQRRQTDLGPLHSMEADLAVLWKAVRAARALRLQDDTDHSLRRSRPKWD